MHDTAKRGHGDLGHAQAGRLRLLYFIDDCRTDRAGIVGASHSLVDVRMILLLVALQVVLDLLAINVYIHVNENSTYKEGSRAVHGLRLF